MNVEAMIQADAQKRAARKLDKDVLEAVNNGAVLIDGQARAIASGLFNPVSKDEHAPSPMSQHPYEQMCEEACKRFPNCQREILDFFALEQQRNMDPDEVAEKAKNPEAYMRSRGHHWAFFFSGLKELDKQRGNLLAISKRQEKKAKKGKKLGPKPGFRGPTFG